MFGIDSTEFLVIVIIAVIVIGVTLRLTGYEVGLPYSVVKYGGSLLWGVMVYLLVTVALPARPGRR